MPYEWCPARLRRAPFFYVSSSFFFFLLLLASFGRVASAENVYLAELQQAARVQGLAKTPAWLRLLHYHSRPLGLGARSLADDPGFFNAPDGASDPQAELDATLAAFFLPQSTEAPELAAQCRFVARYKWLRDKLEIDSARLPLHHCSRFEEFYQALKPRGVSLIFPSAYLNNPSSMFGHTLLRIDGEESSKDIHLLSYAASYAANTGNDGGVLFALKGLAGGYPGIFSVEPYYERVKAYSDIESREIWEYRLSFTEEETKRVLEHLWELRQTAFDYYFFDENCSYHILSLLEHARPELRLSEQFVWYAIPSDTVQAIAAAPGLVAETRYRPALGTELFYQSSLLPESQRDLAFALAEGELSEDDPQLRSFPVVAQAKILELAGEYANYLILRESEPEQSAQERAMGLLLARAKLGVQESFPEVPTPAVRPDQGHAVARAGLGYGVEDERDFYELQLRASYHDVLDPQQGYLEGAEIEFFSMRAKHLEGDRLELEEFLPVRILSLAPRESFRRPLSWKIRAGLERKRVGDSLGKYLGQVRGGAGNTWRVLGEGLFYAMLDASFELSPRYGTENYAVGIGPSAGLLYDVSEKLRLRFAAHGLRFDLGLDHEEFLLESELRFTLSKNLALRLSGFRKGEFEQSWNGVKAMFHWYY